jgi:hypothetical protein
MIVSGEECLMADVSSEREWILQRSREAKVKKSLDEQNARILVCPEGCTITLYIPGDAWCPHGKMKELNFISRSRKLRKEQDHD